MIKSVILAVLGCAGLFAVSVSGAGQSVSFPIDQSRLLGGSDTQTIESNQVVGPGHVSCVDNRGSQVGELDLEGPSKLSLKVSVPQPVAENAITSVLFKICQILVSPRGEYPGVKAGIVCTAARLAIICKASGACDFPSKVTCTINN